MQDFQIIQILGRGSYGTIEKAKNVHDGKIVCIKTQEFQDDHNILKFLQQESHILFGLDHPNIVKYFRSFVENNRYYIVLEYIDGVNLEQFLVKNGILNEQQALYYFIQLLSALKYCHDNKVIHRDVKPQNIMISTNNQLKLVAFGISRNIEHAATTPIGTPFYMAPEIFANQSYSFTVDVWSLGCVLFEMVTGKKPFGDNPMLFIYNAMNN
jgi:serine/threonine protein kinase